jgi:N-acetylmuramoyl-L-alanine amidase
MLGACLAIALMLPASGAVRVVLDPGHGGVDGGAYWGGVKEKDLTLKLARSIETELRARGLPVTLTRRTDTFISLENRAAIANRFGRVIFVSLHFNASTDRRLRGIETYYCGPEGKSLARGLSAAIDRPGGLANRGCRWRNFAVLRRTLGPAALIECGYLSHDAERRICTSTRFQASLAKNIARGITSYVTGRPRAAKVNAA